MVSVGMTETAEQDAVTLDDLVNMAQKAVERIELAKLLGVLKDPNEFSGPEYELARSHPALPLLYRAASTYKERRAAYGASEQKFADIAMAMFPDGLHLRTRKDWVRYGMLHQIIGKLARYAKDFFIPHIDSIHDIVPYAAMLEAEDRRSLNQPPFDRP
jgi:hypothetical protein